jgi:hypothetical protein
MFQNLLRVTGIHQVTLFISCQWLFQPSIHFSQTMNITKARLRASPLLLRMLQEPLTPELSGMFPFHHERFSREHQLAPALENFSEFANYR